MTATATYLYALTRPLCDAELPAVRGVCGAPVRQLVEDQLACLVSTVELATFGEQALQANLEDLGWLQRVAVEHDAVVNAAAARTTTAPLRLATVCADDDAVRARLRRLSARAITLLTRLDGRDEWGVKLLGAAPRPAAAAAAGGVSGSAYLQRRRAALDERERAAAAALRQADAVFDELLMRAVAGERHRPQDRRLSGLDRPMLLNAAFLVDRTARADFRCRVDDIARSLPPGSLVLTGPWPPYSFVALDES
jgi:hypothetical protein